MINGGAAIPVNQDTSCSEWVQSAWTQPLHLVWKTTGRQRWRSPGKRAKDPPHNPDWLKRIHFVRPQAKLHWRLSLNWLHGHSCFCLDLLALRLSKWVADKTVTQEDRTLIYPKEGFIFKNLMRLSKFKRLFSVQTAGGSNKVFDGWQLSFARVTYRLS